MTSFVKFNKKCNITKKAKKFGFYGAFLLLVLTFCSCKSKKISSNSTENTTTLNQTFEKSKTGDDTLSTFVLLSTEYGNIKIKLYNETPRHKNNFLKLVKSGFYDSLLFHRVISSFMIQGGDPESKNAKPGAQLGEGDLGYTVPAEFNENLFHKKGTLCAAREGDEVNPTKASSACQFYLVQGKKFQDNDLKKVEYRINKILIQKIRTEILSNPENENLKIKLEKFTQEKKEDSVKVIEKVLNDKVNILYEKTPHYTFSKEQVETYKTLGGTPHLDGSYTVFGEVTEGLEVIDKIAELETDEANRPRKDVRMKISLIKN